MAKKISRKAAGAPSVPPKLEGKLVFLAGDFWAIADNWKELILTEKGKVVDTLSD